jgi:hypothetical protein
VGVALKNTGLLLQLFGGLADTLELDAVLQGDVDVVLHDKLHGLHLLRDRGELVNLGEIVVLATDLLEKVSAGAVEAPLFGRGGFLACLSNELQCGTTRHHSEKVSHIK